MIEGDGEWLGSLLEHIPEVVKGVSEAFGGITTDEFDDEVTGFFDTATHPTLGVPYGEVTYRPMRELLAFLEENGFEIFVCTGGGRDFVRAVSEELYGIPRQRVIGRRRPVEYRDGKLVRAAGSSSRSTTGPASPSTSGPAPAACRRSPAATPMSTSRC